MSESIRYFHLAFISILATIAWSEIVDWWRHRQLAKCALNGGEDHDEQTVLYVLSNGTDLERDWIKSSIRNALKDSIPKADILFLEPIESAEEEDERQPSESRVFIAKRRAIKALRTSEIKLLRFGIGINIETLDGLRNATIAIVAGDDEEKTGLASSLAVPPEQFQREDVEVALCRAWTQVLIP